MGGGGVVVEGYLEGVLNEWGGGVGGYRKYLSNPRIPKGDHHQTLRYFNYRIKRVDMHPHLVVYG